MKHINAKLFFILQLLIIIATFTKMHTLNIFLKGILIIYIILLILKKKENKNIKRYIILSIITVLLYGYYIELTFGEMITFVINQLYIPSTISYLIGNHKKFNNIKARNHICLSIAPIILGLYIIISKLLNINITLSLIKALLILSPLLISNLKRENTLKNILILVPIITAILISNIDIIIYLFIITGVVTSIFNHKNKKINYLVSSLLLVIPIIYIMLFKNYIIDLNFYVDKTIFSILLEVIMYYIPFLYIIGKNTPTLNKAIKNNNQIFYYYLSVILTFIIGIYQSTTFDSIIFLIIYFSVITNYLNKLEIATKDLKEKEITILALHLGYGGIEQYLSSLCKMLEDDYEIRIVSTYKLMKKPAFYFNESIKIKYLIKEGPNKEQFKDAIKNKQVIKIIKEGSKALRILMDKYLLNIEEIENITSKYVITTRDFHNEIVGNYIKNDVITIATEHNYHNDDKKYINKVVNSVKNIKYFVLVSENLKDFYKDKVKSKCIFIPNVIDSIPNKSTKSSKHNIISVGRLSKEKGQMDLIDVVKILKDKYKDIKLYLIGDGEEKENLSNYIKENKLTKNIELTGFLSKNDIELKMLDSKIFVTTSHTESFGLVVLEACSYKLPVVAFDSADGIKSLLSNDNGVLIKHRNKKQMAKQIIELFENKNLYEKISNQGYENCKKYLAENVKQEWLKIIK